MSGTAEMTVVFPETEAAVRRALAEAATVDLARIPPPPAPPTRAQRWRARRRARALLPTSRIGLLVVFVQADAILLTVAWTLALRYHVHFSVLWGAGSWRP